MSNAKDQPHPSTMTDDQKAELQKSDPAAFDQDAEVEGSPPAAAEGADPDKGAADAGGTGDGAPAAAAAPAAEAGTDGTPAAEAARDDKGDDKPVDQRAFNGLLRELRETRDELKAFKQQATAAAPRDFAAEAAAIEATYDTALAALAQRYEDADLDQAELLREQGKLNKELNAGMRELGKAEAAHAALDAVTKRDAEKANEAATQSWQQQIGAWREANAEFLGNPIRRDAVAKLLDEYGKDATLSDVALLKKVEDAVFEAFNWNKTTATPTPDNKDPHAERRRAAAAATASAAAMPGLPEGGVGVRGNADTPVDLQQLKPGKFSSLPKAEQEKMLGAGALD